MPTQVESLNKHIIETRRDVVRHNIFLFSNSKYQNEDKNSFSALFENELGFPVTITWLDFTLIKTCDLGHIGKSSHEVQLLRYLSGYYLESEIMTAAIKHVFPVKETGNKRN